MSTFLSKTFNFYSPTHKFNALSFRYIILWIINVHYLVKVIDTPFVVIVIFDDFWSFVIPVAHSSIPMQSAHQKNVSLFFGVIRHQSMGLGEGKLGWEPSPVCFWHQCRGSSGLFLRTVPTMYSFLFSSCRPRACEVKKLSQVIVFPCRPSVMSRTTRMPWFFSDCAPAGLPVYTCMFHA